MTKEEFYKLIKQVDKNADVVVTWTQEGKTCTSFHRIIDVKVNLTRNRLELSIDDC